MDPGENLHPFGTFEQGCAPWYAYQATGQQDSVPHGGALSCRICATSATGNFAADDLGFLASPAPGTYRAEAWVRQVAGAAIPIALAITLRTKIGDTPATFPETKSGPPVTVSTTWAHVEVELTVTQTAEKLNVVVGSPASTGACFLVDDVRAFRVK